jgi:hypothetical protein
MAGTQSVDDVMSQFRGNLSNVFIGFYYNLQTLQEELTKKEAHLEERAWALRKWEKSLGIREEACTQKDSQLCELWGELMEKDRLTGLLKACCKYHSVGIAALVG